MPGGIRRWQEKEEREEPGNWPPAQLSLASLRVGCETSCRLLRPAHHRCLQLTVGESTVAPLGESTGASSCSLPDLHQPPPTFLPEFKPIQTAVVSSSTASHSPPTMIPISIWLDCLEEEGDQKCLKNQCFFWVVHWCVKLIKLTL